MVARLAHAVLAHCQHGAKARPKRHRLSQLCCATRLQGIPTGGFAQWLPALYGYGALPLRIRRCHPYFPPGGASTPDAQAIVGNPRARHTASHISDKEDLLVSKPALPYRDTNSCCRPDIACPNLEHFRLAFADARACFPNDKSAGRMACTYNITTALQSREH